MEQQEITVKAKTVINAGPGTTMIFSCLCFAFAAEMLGFLGKGAGIAVGLLQLGVFVGYTIGSVCIMKSGADMGGNTFFIFAALFAGAGGVLTVGGSICEFMGMPFCWQVGSLVNVICGLMLIIITFAHSICSKTEFLIILFAAVGVLCAGLAGFIWPAGFMLIGGISLGLDGIVTFYTVACAYLSMSGYEIDMGEPLRKLKA